MTISPRTIRRVAAVVTAASVVSWSLASRAQGQTIPRSVATGRVASRTAMAEALLEKTISIQIDRLPIDRALDTVAAVAGAAIVYKHDVVVAAVPHLVTLRLHAVPLREAFTRLLEGSSLRVIALPDGQLGVIDVSHSVGAEGSITGYVTDSKTRQPVRGALVVLDDSAQRVRTDNDGHYRMVHVSAGSHRIMVRFVGFARASKMVVVTDGEAVRADIALLASVNTLDQVVVTATGAQRYRELGHVVTQIDADSLVREAPITSVSELLTARVPGLQVLGTNGGSVGGEVSLRLRGTTTTSLDPQPIVVVDGVRYKNTNTINGAEDVRPLGVEERSPLNDLNVNDIETIEVVKGPSASTLYGPDAANGVIVITTKRGKIGKPQWHVYAYPDLSTLSVGSKGGAFDRPAYQGWGHIPETNSVYPGQCTLLQQAAHQCILDSLTVVPSVVNDPQLSAVTKQRPQWHSGASVSGGTSNLLYFFSGNYDSQTGALRLSPIAKDVLEQALGPAQLTEAMKTPNTQRSVSLRTNLTSELSPTSRISLAASYLQANQRAAAVNVMSTQFGYNPFEPGVSYTAADSLALLESESGAAAVVQTSAMNINRLTATLSGSAQPRPWLGANATIGTDLDNSIDRALVPGVTQCATCTTTSAQDYRRNNTNRNAHLGVTALAHPRMWSFRTSAGVDYAYTNQDALNTSGSGLAPGSTDISTASTKDVVRQWTETAQLGGYGEEVIGLRDRLFFTASLRVDGSTTFGDAYAPRPYPKLGLSWTLSDEPFMQRLRTHGLDAFRLRYSYGSASRSPTSIMKNGNIFSQLANVENQTTSTFFLAIGANPDLRPERSREAEWGADATIASVIQLGLTWYHRRTDDVLQNVAGPRGALVEWDNVGDLSASGFEATLDAKILETRTNSLDLHLAYSYATNKVLSLGGDAGQRYYYGGYTVGYPLGAAFGTRTIGYVDSAGGQADGYITQDNEVLSSPQEYLGTVFAPTTYSIVPVFSTLGGRIRISTMFDGQRGGVMFNYQGTCINNAFYCRSTFLKETPLFLQAVNLGVGENRYGDAVQSSNFVRWREFDLTGDVPWSIRRRLHLTRASASLQVRNLALWSHTGTADPESVPGLGVDAGFTSIQSGVNGIPQPRAWTIRFDISP